MSLRQWATLVALLGAIGLICSTGGVRFEIGAIVGLMASAAYTLHVRTPR